MVANNLRMLPMLLARKEEREQSMMQILLVLAAPYPEGKEKVVKDNSKVYR